MPYAVGSRVRLVAKPSSMLDSIYEEHKDKVFHVTERLHDNYFLDMDPPHDTFAVPHFCLKHVYPSDIDEGCAICGLKGDNYVFFRINKPNAAKTMMLESGVVCVQCLPKVHCCDKCGKYILKEDSVIVTAPDGNFSLCPVCAKKVKLFTCVCGKTYEERLLPKHSVCSCGRTIRKCDDCGKVFNGDFGNYCPKCVKNHVKYFMCNDEPERKYWIDGCEYSHDEAVSETKFALMTRVAIHFTVDDPDHVAAKLAEADRYHDDFFVQKGPGNEVSIVTQVFTPSAFCRYFITETVAKVINDLRIKDGVCFNEPWLTIDFVQPCEDENDWAVYHHFLILSLMENGELGATIDPPSSNMNWDPSAFTFSTMTALYSMLRSLNNSVLKPLGISIDSASDLGFLGDLLTATKTDFAVTEMTFRKKNKNIA